MQVRIAINHCLQFIDYYYYYYYYCKQQRTIRPLTGCNTQHCIHDTMLELRKISFATF